MRKSIAVLVLVAIIQLGNLSFGQKYRNIDFFSTSLNLGFNTVPRPKNPAINPASIGFHLNSNFAYKVDYTWGVRGDFGLNIFNSTLKPNIKSINLGIGAFADILQFGTEGYVERIGEFSLLAYSTVGLISAWQSREASGDTKYINGNDDMAYFNLGVMPRIRVHKDITVNFDLAYNVTFFQDRYFDGSGLIPKKRAGGFLALSFGMTYEFK